MFAKIALIACLFGLAHAGGNPLGIAAPGLAGGLHGHGLGYPGSGLGDLGRLGYPGLSGLGQTLGYGAGGLGHTFGYSAGGIGQTLGYGARGLGFGNQALGLAGGSLLSEHQYGINQPTLGNAYGAQGYKIDVYGANYASGGW